LISRHVLSGVLMFYLFLFSVFYLPWLSHVSYIKTLCYNILIHINIIMATCKQSRFDITGLKLHHASFVISHQVIFCKWLFLLLFKPDGLYVWLIIKKEYIIFGFTWSWLEPTIYRTQDEHASHYNTNVFRKILKGVFVVRGAKCW
jgi:signal transduction histidine kinase